MKKVGRPRKKKNLETGRTTINVAEHVQQRVAAIAELTGWRQTDVVNVALDALEPHLNLLPSRQEMAERVRAAVTEAATAAMEERKR